MYACYRQHLPLLLTGKAKHADIWNDFCTCVGKEIDSGLLPDALKTTAKNEQMFALCRSLHKKYKLGIITDNGTERFELLIPEMQLTSLFDSIILSGKIGSRKDEPYIFEKALASASCAADECIFIDNYEKNLIVPAKMGFKTYFHDHHKNDVVSLRQWLEETGCTTS